MSAPPAIHPETIAAQRRASDPGASAWVSAHAGSGKTHVLAQRVIRILLQGAAPSKLLCLTFTKAAAANMAQRVHRILAGWTLLPDDALAAAVEATGAPRPAPAELAFARRLFARAVETPGGLKILTIHAFCERLLHLFPFEANVAAGFEVLEDERRALLLERARNAALEAAERGEDGLGAPLRELAGEVAPAEFDGLLREAMQHRDVLAAMAEDPEAAALRRHLGLEEAETEAEIRRRMLEDGIAPARWPKLAELLRTGKKTDQDQAERLARALAAYGSQAHEAALESYVEIFFAASTGEIRKRFVTGDIAKPHPKVPGVLEAEARRLQTLSDKLKSARAFARSRALLTLAGAVQVRYERLKSERSLLDFDDLIRRARNLLLRSDAAWVLYKLDQGIDHILVDEAQDTSPAQWDILDALAREFTAGRGARAGGRTFFAVGDEKQSIFSFQGAAPHMFARQRRAIGAAVAAARQTFEPVLLTRSFRSAPQSLAFIDRVFQHGDNAAGLSAEDVAPPAHEAIRHTLAGMVQFWDVFAPIEAEASAGWRMPLDNRHQGDPASRLARAMAQAISEMTLPGSPQRVTGEDGAPRPVRAGDVMVLVRARNAVFEASIRALKEKGVPVAGADRMRLTRHIAVMDLMALGRALLLPQDDLTLAAVLKGPLIGLDDDDLIELAPGREGSLRDALDLARAPRHRDIAAKLAKWRQWAESQTPFAFYTRLLGAEGGRREFLARLGIEAADAIDEFIRLALEHERADAPSLAAFLAELDSADLEVKRDMESAGDAVRVMTVHAAKGLEAKIVFLPDTCGKPGAPRDPAFFRLGEGEEAALLWSPRSGEDPPAAALARENIRRLAVEEHRRLLYVALTRAEERLYIAGFCGVRGPAEGCWRAMTHAAFADADLARSDAPWGEGAGLWTLGAPQRADTPGAAPQIFAPPRLPGWLLRVAPAEDEPLPPIRPSRAVAAADKLAPFDAPAGADSAARQAGRWMHALLQVLPDVPPGERRAAGLRFLAAHGAADAERMVAEALAVVEHPELAALFGANSRAEVAVSGRIALPNGRDMPIVGQIDRLAVSADAVWIADFKTGRPRPPGETPMAYIVQLALYRAVLAQLYPDRPIRAALVWTQGPQAVEIGAGQLDLALSLAKLA